MLASQIPYILLLHFVARNCQSVVFFVGKPQIHLYEKVRKAPSPLRIPTSLPLLRLSFTFMETKFVIRILRASTGLAYRSELYRVDL